MSARVLVTGALGFVGKSVVAGALTGGFSVCASSRQKVMQLGSRVGFIDVGDLDSATDWSLALQGVHSVVHCAARAHVLHETAVDPQAAFRLVNVDGTLNLARQAVAARVKRFVFLSSIGVNGTQTAPGDAFSEAGAPHPQNAYAISKWEAEQGLRHMADQTGLEVVIIRPPLVYGLGAPGNFGALMRAVQKGWPLPLGAVHNQRSLVALDNLVDFIITCITHPKAANQTFLISDGQDLSTTELVRGMAQAAGVPARLLPVPMWALEWAGRLVGKGDAVQRLCGNLQIDSSKARDLLGWEPKVSVHEGLRRAMLGNAQP
ncbi:SDR family oxidoreductase [Rhodoferax sp. 4810]|nr:SDR family oxidoreductase [Rhodoferax jenense]